MNHDIVATADVVMRLLLLYSVSLVVICAISPVPALW